MGWIGRRFCSNVKPEPLEKIAKSYDFIIVGGGSAGAVVAARLSEDPSVSVLLLEAGDVDNSDDISLPTKNADSISSELDWGYVTEPQKHACGGNKDLWPRAKVLGGCSAVGNATYTRGCPEDFDSWEQTGAKGWSYESVFEHFLKSEDCRASSSGKIHPQYHQFRGLLTTDIKKPFNSFSKAFVWACVQLGYKEVDYNADGFEGVSYFQHTVRDGIRCSTALSYLSPAKQRHNLHIVTGADVTKILFKYHPKRNVATGVECYVDKQQNGETGRKITIHAIKEVICCAGAINSPKLLLLSGVGPKSSLTKLGIPCIVDLPCVGKYLEDHLQVPLIYKPGCKSHPELTRSTNFGPLTSKQWKDLRSKKLNSKNIGSLDQHSWRTWWSWIIRGEGPRSTSGHDAHLLVHTAKESRLPDIEIKFSPTTPECGDIAGQSRAWYDCSDIEPKKNVRQGFTMWVTLLHPCSKGTISLRTSDPFSAPIIDPQYLWETLDVETLIVGIKGAHSIVQNAQPLNKHVEFLVTPERISDLVRDGVDLMTDDEALETFIRAVATTAYSPACSCRIGSVVDPELIVYGTKNLRVIDASVMPHLPSGDLNAPTIMIGEKGAALISQFYDLHHTVKTLPPPPSECERYVYALGIAIFVIILQLVANVIMSHVSFEHSKH